ncbi:unnamed protein product [Urochloa humidicola]
MVGTYNGLLCLHDYNTNGGFSAVTVCNPVTNEAVTLPPVPKRWAWAQFAKAPGHYSFGFHRETKLHKVVYIPRGHRWSLDALQVFTLGDDKAWRAVPVPVRGACHDLLCEPISVAGVTYWLAAGRVMALDLGDESIASLDAPPAMMARPATGLPPEMRKRDTSWRLTKVGASLGVVVPSAGISSGRMDVWVLDVDGGGVKKPLQWSRRYSVANNVWSSWIMAPQLTHEEYVLSALHDWACEPPSRWWKRSSTLYRHEVGELVDGGDDGWQWQLLSDPYKGAQLNMSKEEQEGKLMIFAFVETRNPVLRSK